MSSGSGQTPEAISTGIGPVVGRVLVADDDDDVRALITDVLERDGHDVDAVPDGGSAWEWARGRRYDVLVLDADMPHLSGFEVVARIRALSETGGTPVLMVSARTRKRDVDRALAEGADAFLAKPFRIEDLSRLVRALMEKRHVPPSVATDRPQATGGEA